MFCVLSTLFRNSVSESLPNCSGAFINRAYSGNSSNGIFGASGGCSTEDIQGDASASYANGARNGWMRVIHFSLSRASSVYADSANVVPFSMEVLICIKY